MKPLLVMFGLFFQANVYADVHYTCISRSNGAVDEIAVVNGAVTFPRDSGRRYQAYDASSLACAASTAGTVYAGYSLGGIWTYGIPQALFDGQARVNVSYSVSFSGERSNCKHTILRCTRLR